MKELWKNLHSVNRTAAVFYGAIGSLLASAIVKFSPSALAFLGDNTFGVLANFIDSRYAKAATLEPTNYSYFIFVLMFVVVVIAWMEISGAFKKTLRGKSTEELEEEKNKNMAKIPKWVPAAFVGFRIFVWFCLAWGFLYVAGEAMVLNAITDFKQHVRIVSPYIETKEKELLLSEWSQMRGIEDYNDIYKNLIEISKVNGLILYKNKLY